MFAVPPEKSNMVRIKGMGVVSLDNSDWFGPVSIGVDVDVLL